MQTRQKLIASAKVQAGYLEGSTPPSLRDVKIYFSQKGISESEAESFYQFYEQKAWMNGKRRPVKNWKHKAWLWAAGVVKVAPWLYVKNVR